MNHNQHQAPPVDNWLIEWKATIPLYRQKVEHEYDPLEVVLTNHKSDWLQLLDQCYDMPLFKKADKLKMQHLICELSENFIKNQ